MINNSIKFFFFFGQPNVLFSTVHFERLCHYGRLFSKL